MTTMTLGAPGARTGAFARAHCTPSGTLRSVLQTGPSANYRRNIPRVSPRTPHNARAWFLGAVAAHLAGIDPDAVALAMTELLSNVVRHAPGPASLAIRATAAGLELACADRSVTLVDPASIPDVPDFTAESGRGLAIVKNLAGGAIRVEQRPGGGQRINIVIPNGETP